MGKVGECTVDRVSLASPGIYSMLYMIFVRAVVFNLLDWGGGLASAALNITKVLHIKFC